MSNRNCGSCQLCCELLDIETLNKQENQRCRYQNARGCSIYNTRPNECRAFTCAWLEGALEKRMRPDKIGAVFWVTKMIGTAGTNFPVIAVNARPGRIDTSAMQLVRKISHQRPVVVTKAGVNSLYQRGERVVQWVGATQFIGFKIDDAGMMIDVEVTEQADVLDTEEKRAAWQKSKDAARTVTEENRP